MRRARLIVAAAAFLLAGLPWVAASAWAKEWQGDVPGRPARVRAGARARSRGAPLVAPAAQAGQSAWDLVWKSETATQDVSVRGRVRTMVQIEWRGERAIAHVLAADGKVRLNYEAGSRRWSLIDDGRNLIRLRPESEQALVLPRPGFVIDKALAERNYVARVSGAAEAVGRPVRIVEIAPRSGGPPVWRLWLDRETCFALKREGYSAEDELATATEYVAVEFGVAVPPGAFSIPAGWARIEADGGGMRLEPEALSAGVGFAVRLPRYLPPGYVLQGGYLRQERPHGHARGEARGRPGRPPVAELRYTDGIRVLSVFQRQRTEEEAQHGERRGKGGPWRHRHGREAPKSRERMVVNRGNEKVVRYLGAERVVIVAGDLTEDELTRVAKSIE